MAKNQLKEVCESEGIRQSELAVKCGVGYSTINKLCNKSRRVSPTTESKVLRALNELCGKDYTREDVFDTTNVT